MQQYSNADSKISVKWNTNTPAKSQQKTHQWSTQT